jgi:hypothetical protein
MIDLLEVLALTPFVPTAGIPYSIIKYFKYQTVPVLSWNEFAVGWIAFKYLNFAIWALLTLLNLDD